MKIVSCAIKMKTCNNKYFYCQFVASRARCRQIKENNFKYSRFIRNNITGLLIFFRNDRKKLSFFVSFLLFKNESLVLNFQKKRKTIVFYKNRKAILFKNDRF